MKSPRERLALAAYGEWPSAEQRGASLDDLYHRVGDLRRQVEDAHALLDTIGAPREDRGGGTLTVRGRIERFTRVSYGDG